MLACVSPSYQHYEETLNTLKYAARARRIQNHAKRNIKSDKKSIIKVKKLISELKDEICNIKLEIEHLQNQQSVPDAITVSWMPSRRNSCPNILFDDKVDVDDLLDVLKIGKAMDEKQKNIKTLKNFLQYEFIELQKLFQVSISRSSANYRKITKTKKIKSTQKTTKSCNYILKN